MRPTAVQNRHSDSRAESREALEREGTYSIRKETKLCILTCWGKESPRHAIAKCCRGEESAGDHCRRSGPARLTQDGVTHARGRLAADQGLECAAAAPGGTELDMCGPERTGEPTGRDPSLSRSRFCRFSNLSLASIPLQLSSRTPPRENSAPGRTRLSGFFPRPSFYKVSHTKQVSMHPDVPVQTVWAFHDSHGTTSFPSPTYVSRYGGANLVRN